MLDEQLLKLAIARNVQEALQEDIATGDLTAQLIPSHTQAHAQVISREVAVLCGTAWFEQCFLTLDPTIQCVWHASEGAQLHANQLVCDLYGNARALLTAERAALNFLQLLSATASNTRLYVDAVAGTNSLIMDTRKTLPGLRVAQKYAVLVGGGSNQRIGLFDGILIKENHIVAAGGIAEVLVATQSATVPVQIEVESLDELELALKAGAKLILLDNFNVDQLRQAVVLTGERAQLEASGGISVSDVSQVASTGVHRISIGGITKHIQAIDLSMRIIAMQV